MIPPQDKNQTLLGDGNPSNGDNVHEILNAARAAEGEQEFDENDDSPVEQPNLSRNDATNRNLNSGTAVAISEAVIQRLKKAELVRELDIRNVSSAGKHKADCAILLKNLLLLCVDPARQAAVATALNRPKPLVGFPDTAYWKELKPQDAVVTEPTNRFAAARAPTVPEDESSTIPVKHNFAEVFDRAPFLGSSRSPRKQKNGRFRQDSNGEYSDFSKTVLSKGCVHHAFLRKHNLDALSHPADWMAPFWLRKSTNGRFSVGQCTTNSNLKATLMNAGKGGLSYADFTDFNVDEMQKFMGVQVAHGLCPTPRVDMKFKSQAADPMNGNNLISSIMAPNADQRWRHYKTFFSIQDPRKLAPDRKKAPNFKVEPLLEHMLAVSKEAWILGPDASVDEQTIGFQGNHIDKLRITYKNEGDGFQCDVQCQDGFTFSFYFRNQPAPRKYLAEGLSPLHARCMALFDMLENKFHRIGLDNLYNSAKFARAAYLHLRKVCVSRVTRKGMRGLPVCVVQHEETNKKEQMKVRGTVKAAVLMGDAECPNLVATSVYDTKPVHFLLMTCISIKWVEKSRCNIQTQAVNFY